MKYQKIVLLGYMGSGKSLIGKLLSESLGIPFRDLDSLIELETNSSIAEYFSSKGENYQIVDHIRNRITFARHNLIKEPPFSRINLISCRNLLIYFNSILQKHLCVNISIWMSCNRNRLILLKTTNRQLLIIRT